MKQSDKHLIIPLAFIAGCMDAPRRSATSEAPLVLDEVCADEDPTYCFDVTLHPQVKDACNPKRWLFMAPGSVFEPGVCQNVGGWIARSAFGVPIAPELDRYCIYNWNGFGDPTPADFDDLPPGAQKDCNVVAAYGHPLEALAAADLEAAFLAQIGALESLPTVTGIGAPTRVVIVDSAVDQGFPLPGHGRFDHGEMMGRIVRQLGCPQGPLFGSACLAAVSSQLALPLRYNELGKLVYDDKFGGHFGSWSTLSEAIVEGVRQAVGGNNRIIVNISLGWDGHWGGAYPGTNFMQLDTGPRMVNSAIAFANCRGAMIVAAAGNDSGGANGGNGPSYPAGWARKPAPNARCANLGGAFRGAPPDGYPMLYAAGGMRGTEDLLLNTRPGGVPELLAPAAHTSFDGQDPHAYTGSSVAAAALSAVGAIVWGYLPSEHPKDVMDRVRQNAVVVPDLVPDFCLPNHCATDVRRIDLCRAVASACSAGGGMCNLECAPKDVPSNPDLSSHLFDPAAVQLEHFLTIAEPCSADIWAADPPVDPCPSRQYLTQYGAPWIKSSPGSSTCPVCGINNNSNNFSTLGPSLLLGINEEAPADLSSPTLYVKFVDGSEVMYALDLDPMDLFPGASIEVVDLPFFYDDVDQAAIEFVIEGKYATSDELLLLD